MTIGHGGAEVDGPGTSNFERHVLTSAGIDIGSSTSHVVLSRLTLRRRGSDLSTQFVVSEREALYVSRPLLTPYTTGTRIDVAAVERFVHGCYSDAGITPAAVDAGAVVITGEALNKHNAPQVASMLSRWSGDFICVSAGPGHEAMLAANGSGTVAMSRRDGDAVLNVDIGGGTTKLALAQSGHVTHVAAFSVGARLVAFDPAATITRIEPPALVLAAASGVELRLGATISAGEVARLAATMADVIMSAVTGAGGDLLARLTLTPGVPCPPPFSRLVLSGGVSEYVDGRDSASYGDLGPALGACLRQRLDASGLSALKVPADQGIRATVLGASQFTLQPSGQTCYVRDEGMLPVRSLPVVQVTAGIGTDLQASLASGLAVRNLSMKDPVAVAVAFRGPRDYPALRSCAEALAGAAAGGPLIVVLRDDLARALGRIIAAELRYPASLVVIDGIDVGDLDYLDIGRPMGATQSFPVTVKSLTLSLLAEQESHA